MPADVLSAARPLLLALSTCAAFFAMAACESPQQSTASAEGDTSYTDRMAAEHEGDRPDASPAAMEPDVPVTGREVTYGDGLTGYLAAPEAAADTSAADTAGALPALIAVHEWWGLNDNIRTMARRLAGQGLRVLAVDLYDDQVAEAPQQARQLMQTALSDQAAIRQNVQAARQYLANQHGAPRVGIIGWCFGGGVSINSAIAMPTDLDAAVVYYGDLGNATREALQPVEMPIIGFFGGQDSSIPPQQVRQFEQTLQDLGKDAQVYIYDDAGHAFANPSGQSYVPSAAKDAWKKTTAFLAENLKGEG